MTAFFEIKFQNNFQNNCITKNFVFHIFISIFSIIFISDNQVASRLKFPASKI